MNLKQKKNLWDSKDKDNNVSTHNNFVCEQIKVLKQKTKEYM